MNKQGFNQTNNINIQPCRASETPYTSTYRNKIPYEPRVLDSRKTIDEQDNFDGQIPQEVTIEDKSLVEQVKRIQELEPNEKIAVFKIIDSFLTKKKFKDFFQKNIATL